MPRGGSTTDNACGADRSAAVARPSAEVLAAVVGTENAARDYIVTRDTSLLAAYDAGRLQLAQAVRVADVAVHGDAVLRTRLAEERALIDGWESAVAADVAATGPDATANAAARAAARDATLDRIRAADDELARALDRQNREDTDQDEVRGIALLVGVCAAFAVLNWVVFVRTERRDAEVRDRQIAFAERLQSARTEDEARAVLAGHLEELVPGATVVVTGEDDRSPAARPIVARGDRIGSVVLDANRDLRDSTERWVHDSILRAAPVLATLRTLADAQARAATDPLTGLGNRRLVEDALSRAAAQAQRTGDGFAVAMIDVDRFKRVNDTFGHEAGDALLVAIADALSGATRRVRRRRPARRRRVHRAAPRPRHPAGHDRHGALPGPRRRTGHRDPAGLGDRELRSRRLPARRALRPDRVGAGGRRSRVRSQGARRQHGDRPHARERVRSSSLRFARGRGRAPAGSLPRVTRWATGGARSRPPRGRRRPRRRRRSAPTTARPRSRAAYRW